MASSLTIARRPNLLEWGACKDRYADLIRLLKFLTLDELALVLRASPRIALGGVWRWPEFVQYLWHVRMGYKAVRTNNDNAFDEVLYKHGVRLEKAALEARVTQEALEVVPQNLVFAKWGWGTSMVKKRLPDGREHIFAHDLDGRRVVVARRAWRFTPRENARGAQWSVPPQVVFRSSDIPRGAYAWGCWLATPMQLALFQRAAKQARAVILRERLEYARNALLSNDAEVRTIERMLRTDSKYKPATVRRNYAAWKKPREAYLARQRKAKRAREERHKNKTA